MCDALSIPPSPICICGGVRLSSVLSEQMEWPGHWLGTEPRASFPLLVTRRCPLSSQLCLYGNSKQRSGTEVWAPPAPARSCPDVECSSCPLFFLFNAFEAQNRKQREPSSSPEINKLLKNVSQQNGQKTSLPASPTRRASPCCSVGFLLFTSLFPHRSGDQPTACRGRCGGKDACFCLASS